MASWGEFARVRPDLAEAGRGLFYQFGVGLGFLSTIRPDGGPRLHPMCPIILDASLYAMIIPSQKCRDLIRDGRYAMHCYPCEDNEDAFYITGTAEKVDDRAGWNRVATLFLQERHGSITAEQIADQTLFEFDIETALLTRTKGHGDFNPQHTVWKSAEPDA